ncbi:MAG: ATP-binding protein [Parasphingorhabdus sp.]
MLNISALLLVSAIFGLLAWGGVNLTRDEGNIAVVWLANAFLVAVILRSEIKHIPYYLAGAFVSNLAVNLLVGDTVTHSITLAAINQFEMVLIWLLMRRFGLTRPDMQQLAELGKFCLAGGLVAPLASGLLAGMFFSAGTWQSFLISWLQWTTTDGLGMILLSPAVMVVIDLIKPTQTQGSYRSLLIFNANRREWLAIQLFTLASAITIFWVLSFPVFFLVAPLVLLNAFKLGTPGTSVSIVLIAIVVVIAAAFETGPFYSVELSLTAKLFILQFFLLSCFAVGMPTSAMLAEKAKIRRALRDHREVSNSMLANMHEVIFRTNGDLEWEFLNSAWEKLTGRSIKDSLGQNIADLFDIDGLKVLESHIESIRSGTVRRSRFEGSLHRQDGSEVDIELTFSRLPSDDGSFVGIVGSIRDVTERKWMEQNLVSAREGAEKAADAKTRFLASMSHEIRTPMNGVLGFAQLLMDSDLPAEQKSHARIILESGNAMMRLLNNILDISKVEAGQTNSTIKPMSMQHVLKSCVGLMAPIAHQKKFDLKLEIDQTVPELVLADGDHLRQIMLNLLGNAVKFTKTGAVTVAARADNADAGKIIMHVMVSDTGIGIPSDRLEAIFSPFEQADTDTSQRFGGTGLGLTISRQLVSIMNGTIEVRSTEGKGTTFHIQFPVGEHSTTSIDKKSQTENLMPAGSGGQIEEPDGSADNGKILVAEDHDINQILITEMIKRLGYQTVLAVNGEDAVEKVEAAARENAPFDLVLMDVQMPVMDGYEATETIRMNGHCEAELPILAITANAYPEDIDHCLQSGMQGHISKPVMIGTLQSSLKKWIVVDRHHQPESLQAGIGE